MLRTVPRSICRAVRPSRPPSGKACAACILREQATQLTLVAGQPARSWTSTSRSGKAGRAGHEATLSQQLPSSSIAVQVPVRYKSSVASSLKWEHEGLPVAPLLRDSQKLPSNLTLAQEAWPEQGEEGQEDGERKQPVCSAGWRWVLAGYLGCAGTHTHSRASLNCR